jgi:hypothetical protein
MLILSMGEFLISAGMGSFRNWVEGAIPSSDEAEDVSASVNAGSSSAAVCGTASSMRVFSWYVGAVSAADVVGSKDGSGMGVKRTPPSL